MALPHGTPYDILRRHYEAYLLLERGLSENTRINYLMDVDRVASWLIEFGVQPDDATPADLSAFLSALHEAGIAPRSQARMLSGMRSFYGFLLLEGVMATNPTELLDAPVVGRHLPEVLTIEEIDAMMDAVDLAEPTGRRNRAMLELLYVRGCV